MRFVARWRDRRKQCSPACLPRLFTRLFPEGTENELVQCELAMLCKTCQYPLKQLTEPRCPECGRGFDPKDPRTFDVPQRAWFTRPQAWLAFVLCAFLGFLVVRVGIILFNWLNFGAM